MTRHGCMFIAPGLLIVVVFLLFGVIENALRNADEIRDESTGVPTNSSRDSSVREVREWIKDNANDPKSIEFVEWGRVYSTELDGITHYIVRCKFRGRNAFGALVINEKLFTMTVTGTVVSVTDYQ